MPAAGAGLRRVMFPPTPIWGDCVLIRKENPASYHLAVVLDDAWQGVTRIVRGQDLFAATAVHRLLQHRLGCRRRSTRIIADRRARRSEARKIAGFQTIAGLAAGGASPADIRRMTGSDALFRRK